MQSRTPNTAVRLPSSRHIEAALIALLFAYIAILAVGAMFFDFSGSVSRLSKYQPGTLIVAVVAALGLVTVHYVLRTLRWQFLTWSLGMRIPFGANALFYVGGFSAALTPGKVGEALRMWCLKRRFGLRFRRTMPLMLGDRLLDVMAMLLLASIGVTQFGGHVLLIVTLWLGLAVVLAVVAQTWLSRITVRLIYRLGGRRGRHAFAKLDMIVRYSADVTRMQTILPGLLLSVAGWSLEAAALQILAGALGAHISIIGAMLCTSLASLAGAITILPGGIVGAELTLFALLTAQGVAPYDALVATTLIRLSTLWYGTAIGVLALGPALRLALSRVARTQFTPC